MTRDPPTVPEVQVAPELAALDLLAAAIETANVALVAEHPNLFDIEYAARDGPLRVTAFLADAILRLGDGLTATIAAYRQAVLSCTGTSPASDTDSIDF